MYVCLVCGCNTEGGWLSDTTITTSLLHVNAALRQPPGLQRPALRGRAAGRKNTHAAARTHELDHAGERLARHTDKNHTIPIHTHTTKTEANKARTHELDNAGEGLARRVRVEEGQPRAPRQDVHRGEGVLLWVVMVGVVKVVLDCEMMSFRVIGVDAGWMMLITHTWPH